jgi:two-component system LytT family response regulator
VNKLRALIVDDEPLARERLHSLLRVEDSVEIVGECGSGPEAILFIKNTALDLVFLDMEMPGCDGLQVIAELPTENRPDIIFVTAYEGFAIEAFEVQAIDYLLKPFDRERFQKALQRVREHIAARQAGEKLAKLMAEPPPLLDKKPDRLAVKTDGRVVFVKPDDIIWVEAADNYVVLHLASGRLMLRETMSALETRLGTARFARVNRSAIVHLDQVKEMQPTAHGDYTLVLRDGTKLPLSRSLRSQFSKLATNEG